MKFEDCLKKGLLRKHQFEGSVPGKEIENSKHHLKNARMCVRNSMYDLAVVSAYTSMFHAARALLFRGGFKERSHVCVVAFLRKEFPELETETNILDSYRMNRHMMLYGTDVELAEDDAKKGLELAEKFIEKVESILTA